MLRLRALVADDDRETLRLVSEAVAQLDADVVCAASGDELVERLADGPFDVIVTDVQMPWMTGLQAVHSARTAGLQTPVVVMTGLLDDARIVRQVEALGKQAILLYKPIDLDTLHAAISVLTARGRDAAL